MPTGRGGVRDFGRYVPGGEPQFQVQSIMATFSTERHAEEAARELREAGYGDVQVDRVSEVEAPLPGTQSGPWPRSLTGVPGSERVLAAANPTVSGMSDDFQVVSDENILLTVVIEHDRFDEARRIIRRHGGNYDGS